MKTLFEYPPWLGFFGTKPNPELASQEDFLNFWRRGASPAKVKTERAGKRFARNFLQLKRAQAFDCGIDPAKKCPFDTGGADPGFEVIVLIEVLADEFDLLDLTLIKPQPKAPLTHVDLYIGLWIVEPLQRKQTARAFAKGRFRIFRWMQPFAGDRDEAIEFVGIKPQPLALLTDIQFNLGILRLLWRERKGFALGAGELACHYQLPGVRTLTRPWRCLLLELEEGPSPNWLLTDPIVLMSGI